MAVFAHVEHTELHGAVFRVITGNQFRVAFRNVKRRTSRFGDGRKKEAEECDRLNENAPSVLFLPTDNAFDAKGSSKKHHAHHRNSQADFVADTRRRRAQCAEEREFGFGSPTRKHRSKNGKRRKPEHQKNADIRIDIRRGNMHNRITESEIQ